MGEVIPFPVKNARTMPVARQPGPDQAVDLDRIARIAVFSVLIRALSHLGRGLTEGAKSEVELRGERMWLTREEIFEWAYALIDARDPLLVSLGPGGDTRLMRECGAAFRLTSECGFQQACGAH
jgi:hypothetical protein